MKRCRLFALLLALALALSGCGAAQSETEEAIQVQTSEGSAGCLFENDACSYTLVKTNENALGDYVWDVDLVNKTAQTLVFSMDSVYLNDCKLDPYWAVEVAAGQTLRSAVSWARSMIDACEMTKLVRVDFTLTVYPPDQYGENLAEERITVYPQGESEYFEEARPAHADDVTLLESLDYVVLATGLDTQDASVCTLSLYLLNKSGQDVLFRLDNVRFNGQYVDSDWMSSLAAGKRSFEHLTWQRTALEAKEITEITELSFDVLVCSADGSQVLRQEHASLTP